jgi:hypothetical protein
VGVQVLQHAWYVINNHPNVVLDNHPATAVKKVGAADCVVASVHSVVLVYCCMSRLAGREHCHTEACSLRRWADW